MRVKVVKGAPSSVFHILAAPSVDVEAKNSESRLEYDKQRKPKIQYLALQYLQLSFKILFSQQLGGKVEAILFYLHFIYISKGYSVGNMMVCVCVCVCVCVYIHTHISVKDIQLTIWWFSNNIKWFSIRVLQENSLNSSHSPMQLHYHSKNTFVEGLSNCICSNIWSQHFFKIKVVVFLSHLK